MKVLRTVFGNTPPGSISLPTEAALILLAFGEIKMGEFFCREQMSLTRCFRCLAFDQITTIRTNGNSKSKRYSKCRRESYCNYHPECMFVQEERRHRLFAHRRYQVFNIDLVAMKK